MNYFIKIVCVLEWLSIYTLNKCEKVECSDLLVIDCYETELNNYWDSGLTLNEYDRYSIIKSMFVVFWDLYKDMVITNDK